MEAEKRERRRSIKLIISETIMVVAVAITVIVLAFIVSGYWLNSDFKVERQGLLQVYSTPTGADVQIDGESSWLQRTNTSKVLPSGKHHITLSKEGYDSWSKDITIKEGLLYRLHYPRLFLQNRTSEKVYNSSSATFATVSPDYENLILANNTTSWDIIKLTNEKLEPKKIEIGSFLSTFTPTENSTPSVFSGEILSANWANDNTHLLIKINLNNKNEWILLDTQNIVNSINLSQTFGADFSQIEIVDDSASTLLAVENGNLHRVDAANKQISAIIVKNIISFDHFRDEIVFIARDQNSTPETYYLGQTKIHDTKITKLSSVDNGGQVVISKFYEDKFITTLQGSHIVIYQEEEFAEIKDFELEFTPQSINVDRDGEFIIFYDGPRIASLDMESSLVSEWSISTDRFNWLDESMIYIVEDGQLVVYDYDGLNRRVLAQNVSSRFPAVITGNKWLYYFSDDNFVREWLISR